MKTGSGLVKYAEAQLGKPYWWGTFGQTATDALLVNKKLQYPDYYQATDFKSQLGQKVHDCVGLIKGYRWCDTPDSEPVYVSSEDVAVNGLYIQCGVKGIINNMPDIPGICVFQADMGHVGVYIGNDEVIEAMGHAYGVVKTQLRTRNWAVWGMPSWIDYTEFDNSDYSEQLATESSNPIPSTQQFPMVTINLPLLKRGIEGIPVKKLQNLLLLEEKCKQLIEDSGGADGVFGPGTEKAVITYQKNRSLMVDGKVGAEVWTALITT